MVGNALENAILINRRRIETPILLGGSLMMQ
jgi:hypothetical protein